MGRGEVPPAIDMVVEFGWSRSSTMLPFIIRSIRSAERTRIVDFMSFSTIINMGPSSLLSCTLQFNKCPADEYNPSGGLRALGFVLDALLNMWGELNFSEHILIFLFLYS